MKKVISLLSSLFIILVIQGNELSYNPDSLNMRSYESQYLFPEIMNNCNDISLDVIPNSWTFTDYVTSSGIWNRYNYFWDASYISDLSTSDAIRYINGNIIHDFAQPYYTDTNITVVGISGYVHNRNSFYINSDNRFDTNYYFYLELWDSSLTNIIRSVDITDRRDFPFTDSVTAPTLCYTEVFFDSPININGKFYIVYHTPDTIFDSTSTKRLDIYATVLGTAFCSTDMLPLKREINYNWESFTTENCFVTPENVKTVTMLYLFPILSEYNPNADEWHGVGLNETRDISNFTHVFPNPTKEEVNINCGYKIKSLQVYDEQGKVLLEKEVNAYNYQINLNPLPQGTYFIKVITNSGQTAKKIIRN